MRAGVPANVRGAKYTRDILGHQLSSKPKMLYISKMPNNYPTTNVICFDEDSQVPPGTEVDIEKMLKKIVKDKLEPIFEALGWKLSELNPFWRGRAPKAGTQDSLFSLGEFEKNLEKSPKTT